MSGASDLKITCDMSGVAMTNWMPFFDPSWPPNFVCAVSFVAVAVDGAVGPTAKHRADEALRFPVGARPIRARAQVFDPKRFAGERVDRGAVGGAVIRHQPLDADPVGGEVCDRLPLLC